MSMQSSNQDMDGIQQITTENGLLKKTREEKERTSLHKKRQGGKKGPKELTKGQCATHCMRLVWGEIILNQFKAKIAFSAWRSLETKCLYVVPLNQRLFTISYAC